MRRAGFAEAEIRATVNRSLSDYRMIEENFDVS
jgi:hypothetical protein